MPSAAAPTSPPLNVRAAWFWAGCAAIVAGVLMHLPMLAHAHAMGGRLAGMPTDIEMIVGMALIAVGVPAAIFGALPPQRTAHGSGAVSSYSAPDDMPLNRWHAATLMVLIIGLVIDVMKPATLGFVLPGLATEYGVERSTAALLPLVALIGTTVGSVLWGWVADAYGRRPAIMLSTILFVSTSICGAMPEFALNLVMCFLMGASAGGLLPVVYTLLTEIMPARQRSWVLVLVGGLGLVGGYLAASAAAHAIEPLFGWRALWLLGFPTGILFLALARFIPESPRFLAEQGRTRELEELSKRFGIVPVERRAARDLPSAPQHRGLTAALTMAAISWSFVNFGLLLWLPSDLQQRGYSAALASGIIASSAVLALPTMALTAFAYSRWSSKWTLVAAMLITAAGLGGALLPAQQLASAPVLIAVIALLIVGTNAVIATLLPYAAESYPLGIRGRATGLVAGGSKVGGVAVQLFALLGLVPTLSGAALAILPAMLLSNGLVAGAGRETRGRSLKELETE